MDAQFKVGTFTGRSSNGSLSVTDVPFTPKYLAIYNAQVNSFNSFVNGVFIRAGLANGTAISDQYSHLVSAVWDTLSSFQEISRRDRRQNEVATDREGSLGFLNMTVNLASLNSNGFTLNFTFLAGVGPHEFFYLAIGGTGVTASLENVNWPTSAGAVSFTSPGFQPDTLLVYGGSDYIFGESETSPGACWSQGWVDTQGRQAVSAVHIQNATPNNVHRYQRTTKCLAILDSTTGAVAAEAEFVSYDTLGYTLNFTTPHSAVASFTVVALKGVFSQSGSFNQPTSPQEQELDSLEVNPSVMMFQSVGGVTSASVQNDLRFSFGLASVDDSFGIWNGDTDGTTYGIAGAGRRNVRRMSNTRCIVAADPVSDVSATIVASASVVGANPFGTVTLDWDVADGTARENVYLILGGEDSIGPAGYSLTDAIKGKSGPIFWSTLAGRDIDGSPKKYPWAPISICDPPTYYEGYKAPILTSIGEITIPLSDRNGRLQIPQCSVSYSDYPGSDGSMLLRGMLGRTTQRALRGKEFTIYTITDRDRRLLKTPMIAFRGYVDTLSGDPDWDFTINAKGWLAKRHNSRLWEETIGDLFSNAPLATRSIALPIALGRLSDAGSIESAPVLVEDEAGRGSIVDPGGPAYQSGYGDLDPPPTNVVAVENPGIGNIPAGDYKFFVTRVVGGVESNPSAFLPENGELVSAGANAAITVTCDDDGADSYRFYLLTPIVGSPFNHYAGNHYIETTDPVTGVQFTDLPFPPTPGGVACVNPFGNVAVLAVMPDGRTALTPSIFIVSNAYLRPVRMAWTPIPGALEYEVYGRWSANPTDSFNIRWSVPPDQLNGNGDVYWEWMWGDTSAFEILTTGAPIPRGKIPPIYLGGGDNTFVDNTGWGAWHAWLVSARPIAEYETGYVISTDDDGVETVTPIDEGSYSTIWAAPGKGFWNARFGPDLFIDINGYRCTLLFGVGPDADAIAAGEKQLRVNVKGLETAGDGTGATVTSIYDLGLLIARNCIVADQPDLTDDFDADPTFSDGAKRVDAASFTEAALNGNAIITSGAAAARWLFGSMTCEEFWMDWCPSAKAKVGIKPDGSLVIAVHNPGATPIRTVTEKLEIFQSSFGFEVTDQGFANRTPFSYNPSYTEGGDLGDGDTGEVNDLTSQGEDQYDDIITDELVAFNWRLNSAQARQLAQAFLHESAYMPQIAKAASSLHWMDFYPGQVLGVTHREGAEEAGYNERKHAILGMQISLSEFAIGMSLLDLRSFVGEVSPFLLELFMGIQELGGSRIESCVTVSGDILPVNYRRGIIDWDIIPEDTHEVVFDIEVAVGTGTITPKLFEYGDNLVPIVNGTSHATSTMTRQQHVVTRPAAGGIVNYWTIATLGGGATDADARMFGRLRIRRIGVE